jgi:hypothetical protein
MKTVFKTVPDTSVLGASPALSNFRPHFVAFVCFCSSAAHRNPKIKKSLSIKSGHAQQAHSNGK